MDEKEYTVSKLTGSMEGDRVLQRSLASSGERMDSPCSVPNMVERVMVIVLH